MGFLTMLNPIFEYVGSGLLRVAGPHHIECMSLPSMIAYSVVLKMTVCYTILFVRSCGTLPINFLVGRTRSVSVRGFAFKIPPSRSCSGLLYATEFRILAKTMHVAFVIVLLHVLFLFRIVLMSLHVVTCTMFSNLVVGVDGMYS